MKVYFAYDSPCYEDRIVICIASTKEIAEEKVEEYKEIVKNLWDNESYGEIEIEEIEIDSLLYPHDYMKNN